jgi:hypothetical protein
MEWVLEELRVRGHFQRVPDRNPRFTDPDVTYRATTSAIPRSVRPALASFAELFAGHSRDITAQAMVDFVASKFGDELWVEKGLPSGVPEEWYERCVVAPLRAKGLVTVGVEERRLGPQLVVTTKYLVPTPEGEGVAARYRDILEGDQRRDWRHGWRRSAPFVPDAGDFALTTLQRSAWRDPRVRLFHAVEYRPESP